MLLKAIAAFACMSVASLLPPCVTAAKAGPTYQVSFTDTGGDSASFVLDLGTDLGGGVYDVSSITGTFLDGTAGASTFTITGLSSYASSDNTFNVNGNVLDTIGYVTFSGLSFALSDGVAINFYDDGLAGYGVLHSDTNSGGFPPQFFVTSLNVLEVPEPISAALLLMGLTMVGVVRRQRKPGS